MTLSAVNGLHHVTAIASSARANHDFFTRILGLRLIKKTVNFDDPQTYHLYYGDAAGHPGTVMTYFPWDGVARGKAGHGETSLTQFAIPRGALGFWFDRLARLNVAHLERETLMGETRLVADDPDGLRFALVEVDVSADARTPWTTDEISAEVAVRGFHGVTLTLADAAPTAAILTELLNFRLEGREGSLTRYRTNGTNAAGIVDLVEDKTIRRALPGAGRVHHIAFSIADTASELALRDRLVGAGLNVTPQIDRSYFRSLYFRTPGGVLFEIATDEPGFAVDEPAETLGLGLQLPAQHEHLRAHLEATLPRLVA
jgi:glyoxalase family protein